MEDSKTVDLIETLRRLLGFQLGVTAPVAEHETIDATQAPANLVARVAVAMANAGEVVKDRTNTEFNYKFASVESMLQAVRGPLLEQGVILSIRPHDFVEDSEVTARSGTKGSRVVVELDFTFTDGVEEFTIARWRGEAIDYSDKAYGKAYTNAIKTFIRAQWLLPAEDDSDGDHTSPERGTAHGGIPAWAGPLNKERAQELYEKLCVLVGPDEAKLLMANVKERASGIPALLLPLAKALLDAYLDDDAEQLAERREAALTARAEVPGANSGADGETLDEPTGIPESDVPPETDGLGPSSDQLRDVFAENDGPLFPEGEQS